MARRMNHHVRAIYFYSMPTHWWDADEFTEEYSYYLSSLDIKSMRFKYRALSIIINMLSYMLIKLSGGVQ